MISIKFWQNINQQLSKLYTFINSKLYNFIKYFGNFAKECFVV